MNPFGHNLTAEELNHMNVYVTQDEIEWMRDEAPKLLPPAPRVVMIGAGPGMLMLSLLDGGYTQPDAKIAVVDIASCAWIAEHLRWATEFQPSRVHPVYTTAIQYFTADSYKVGKEWQGGLLDLLVIDGDHTERGVKRDMEAWLPHVGPRGVVFYHDYLFAGTHWEHLGRDIYPEVQPFVDEIMRPPEWKSIWRGGCSRVFQKQPLTDFEGKLIHA